MEKVSVIMPAYNASKTIKKSIESVLKQNYSNLELIVVDDGSTDNTKEVVLSITDERIKYFYKDNTGVSDTRNFGLKNATSEFVFFIDSDDLMKDNLILESMKYVNDFDQIIFGFDQVGQNTFISSRLDEANLDISNKNERLKFLINNFFQYKSAWNVWNRVFRKSIIDKYNIQFDTSYNYGEDQIFCLEYLKYVNTIKILNVNLYIYTLNDSSISHSTDVNFNKKLAMFRNRLSDLDDERLFEFLTIYCEYHHISKKKLHEGLKCLYPKHFKFKIYQLIRKYKKYFDKMFYYKTIYRIYLKRK